jgi:hypothetical protein
LDFRLGENSDAQHIAETISSENGPSTQEDSLTLALSQREREGVRVFMVKAKHNDS